MTLVEAAVAFLTIDDEYTGAVIEARCWPEEDRLYRIAFMIGERRETARRVLGDAIIAADPSLSDAVRRVVRFAAPESEMTTPKGKEPTESARSGSALSKEYRSCPISI